MVDSQILIIGAGPAGLATALQLKRYGIDFVILEKARLGGLLSNANLVENYPGFPGGIPGHQLVDLFKRQIRQLGVEVTFTEVVSLSFDARLFRITTKDQVYDSRIAVVASGTKAKTLPGVRIPEALFDRVHTEILPIQNVANKQIVVIGAGDLAFDYALNLHRDNDVLILNRGTQTRCLPLLRDRADCSPRIRYRDKTSVMEIKEGAPGTLVVDCVSDGVPAEITADYLLIAIGREPQIDFICEDLREEREDLESRGLLYLIGDATNGIYRQAAIAVGDGIMTAMKIHQTLEERGL